MRRKCWKAWSWWNGDKWIWNRVSKVGFAHSRIKNYLATVTITILSYQKLWDWRRKAPLTFVIDLQSIWGWLLPAELTPPSVFLKTTERWCMLRSDKNWRIHSPPHPNSMNQELLHARWRVNLCWENITRRSEASLPGPRARFSELITHCAPTLFLSRMSMSSMWARLALDLILKIIETKQKRRWVALTPHIKKIPLKHCVRAPSLLSTHLFIKHNKDLYLM